MYHQECEVQGPAKAHWAPHLHLGAPLRSHPHYSLGTSWEGSAPTSQGLGSIPLLRALELRIVSPAPQLHPLFPSAHPCTGLPIDDLPHDHYLQFPTKLCSERLVGHWLELRATGLSPQSSEGVVPGPPREKKAGIRRWAFYVGAHEAGWHLECWSAQR